MQNVMLVVGVVVFAAILLRMNLWRAVLFLKPGAVHVELDTPADQMKLPDALRPLAASLEALGFRALGSRYEKTPLAAPFISYDFAHPGERAFATVYLGRFASPRLYFLTPLLGDGFVITANFRRPARTVGTHYVAAGVPGLSPDRLLKAHQRRLEGRDALGAFDWEGRLTAAKSWVAGPGRAEIRWQNLNGLVSSVLSASLLSLATYAAVRILVGR